MNQRVEAVDAIRGFALFGILLVNMTLIQFGFFTSENQLIYLAILIKVLIGLFNFSAHITLYPYFLFYLGLALFCYKKYYHKRKKILPHIHKTYYHSFTTRLHSRHFCLGGRYFICIRNNRDFLMIFINRKPKTLLIWAIILLALITLMSYQTDPSTNINDFAPYTEKEHKVHQTGSYMDHVNFRLTENPFDYMGIDGAFGLFFISVFAIILCLHCSYSECM